MVHTLLIGLRASGKSTLAPMLAERLGIAHADLDDLVLATLGQPSAGQAFRAIGEPAFREAEHDQLRRALAGAEPTALALGGGAPTAPGAAELLNTLAIDGRIRLVYLRANPSTLGARMHAHDDNRPSLTGKHPRDEIGAIFRRRDALYRVLATHTLNTDFSTPGEILERLVAIAAGGNAVAEPTAP